MTGRILGCQIHSEYLGNFEGFNADPKVYKYDPKTFQENET